MTTLEMGTTVGGRYRIERLLGAGGTGTVALAHDAETNRQVALKVIHRDLSTNPTAVAWFTRRAETAGKLRGEHVVRVNAVGLMEGVGPYAVMEHLQGAVLPQVVEERGRLPVSEAVSCVLDAIDALEEAHALDILHLDLKPKNLFRVERPDGLTCIKLLGGWTLKAEFVAEAAAAPQRLMGSPLYMSPEHLKSAIGGAGSVDARADIWGIGVALYELLAGVPPFHGEVLKQLLVSILSKNAEPLRGRRSEIPEGLEEIVMRCLQRDAKLRYESAGELARALAPFTLSS
jgi:serine/threonine protein kinase